MMRKGILPKKRKDEQRDERQGILPLIQMDRKRDFYSRQSSTLSYTTLGSISQKTEETRKKRTKSHRVDAIKLLKLIYNTKERIVDKNAYLYKTMQTIQENLVVERGVQPKLQRAMHEANQCLIKLIGTKSKQYNTLLKAAGDLLKYSSIQIGKHLKIPMTTKHMKNDYFVANTIWENLEDIYKGDLLHLIEETLSIKQCLQVIWIWANLGILYVVLKKEKQAKRYLKLATKLNAKIQPHIDDDHLEYPMLSIEGLETHKMQNHVLMTIFLKLLFLSTMTRNEQLRMIDHLKKALHLKGYHSPIYLKLKIYFYITASNVLEQGDQSKWMLIANSLYVSNRHVFDDAERLQHCFPVTVQRLQNQISFLPTLQSNIPDKTAIFETTLHHLPRKRAWKIKKHKEHSKEDQNEAAMKIQMWWSKLLLKRKEASYSSMYQKINSTLTIQRFYRGNLSRKRVDKLKHAQQVLYRTIKRHLAMKRVEQIDTAAVMIQTWYRQYYQHQQIERQFQATMIIQSWWRMILVQKKQRLREHAVSIIQPFIRGVHVRKELQLKQRAATYLIHTYRLFNIRRKLKAVVVIVFHWRGYKAWLSYRVKISAAIRIQCAYRVFKANQLVKKRKHAAIRIQTIFRGNRDRTSYLRFKKAFPYLMGALIGYLTRIRLKIKNRAVQNIQRVWRGYQERKRRFIKLHAAERMLGILKMEREAQARSHRESAIRTLQIHYRKLVVNQRLRNQHMMAQKIQRVFMGRSTRHRLICANVAASLIQANVRRMIVKNQMIRESKAATRIHVMVKGIQQRQHLKTTTKAIQRIQQWYRGQMVRVRLQKKCQAANRIRAWFLGIQDRLYLSQLKNETMRIQLSYKSYMARNRVRLEKEQLNMCYRIFLGVFVRLQQRIQTRSVLCIQRMYRGYKDRQAFLIKKQAANVLTAWFKGILRRRENVIRFHAARAIQHKARAFVAKKRVERIHRAVNVIQYWWRGARKRYQYVKLKESTLLLQSYARGFLTRKRSIRSFPVFHILLQNRLKRIRYKLFLQQEVAARRIQRAWAHHNNTPFYKKRKPTRLELYGLISLVQASLRRYAIQVPQHREREAVLRISKVFLYYRSSGGKKYHQRREEAAHCIQRAFFNFFKRKYGISLHYHIHHAKERLSK